MKRFVFPLFLTLTFSCAAPIDAYYTLRGMKVVDTSLDPYMPPAKHLEEGICKLHEGDLLEARRQFFILQQNFPRSDEASDSLFYLGVVEYCLCEWDVANNYLSDYLKSKNATDRFRESIELKYAIAERYRCGHKKRMFGQRCLPKCIGGEMEALDIYDEVSSSLPADELAAKALFGKGLLLFDIGEYGDSVECFQLLIRRFPKHELGIEGYMQITAVYREQCEKEFQNPDILALAQINLKRFAQDFPKEERVAIAAKKVQQIREIYARGLYETGSFYERKDLPKAAVVYYKSAISQFPHTSVAHACWCRLQEIAPEELAGMQEEDEEPSEDNDVETNE